MRKIEVLRILFTISVFLIVSDFSVDAIASRNSDNIVKENMRQKNNEMDFQHSGKGIRLLKKIPDNLKKNIENSNNKGIIVRVLLKRTKYDLNISSRYGFYLISQDDDKIYEVKNEQNFALKRNKIFLENLSFEKGVELIPRYNSPINYENHKYRGKLILHNTDNGMMLVNHVPLEEYLYGVIGREVPTDWSMEALKAQAIAARSYVLYRKKEHKSRLYYDVKATATAQRYGGYNYETDKSIKAVDSTKNKVLTYNKRRLVAAYYHSNSGGYTEDDANLWSDQHDMPYLMEIEDKFSLNEPQENWKFIFSSKSLRNLLHRFYRDMGDIKSILPHKLSKFGRVIELKVLHTNGSTIISGNRFRYRVGSWRIRSTLFMVEKLGDKYIFTGKGFGHGVGMSQWGSKKMAQNGYNYEQILKYYYRNTELSNYRKNLSL